MVKHPQYLDRIPLWPTMSRDPVWGFPYYSQPWFVGERADDTATKNSEGPQLPSLRERLRGRAGVV